MSRGRWEGSLTEASNGKWRAQISVGGVRRSQTCATRREALRWLAQMRAEAERGSRPERITFNEAADRYEEHLRLRAAPSTIASARVCLRCWRQSIGQMPAHRITSARLNSVLAELQQAGYAAETITLRRRVASTVFQRLVEDGQLGRNPMRQTSRPRQQQRDYHGLDTRAHAAVDAARSSRYWYAFALLLATGMRVGELLGLRWSDIEGQQIRIERARTGSLKSASSRRIVTIGASLSRHIESMRGNSDKPVVSACYTTLYYDWNRYSGGLRIHDLRHAHASELIAAGVPVTAVSRRLGHATVSITLNIYAHVIDRADERVAEAVEEISRRIG